MDEHDGLCPECEGSGLADRWCVFLGSYWEPPEYEELHCLSCDGTGTLAALPTEEEAAQSEPWEADEYERWLDGL